MAHVNDESTLVVSDGYERQELEVLFQDEVVLDIEVPLFISRAARKKYSTMSIRWPSLIWIIIPRLKKLSLTLIPA